MDAAVTRHALDPDRARRRDPIGSRPDERAVREVILQMAYARCGRHRIARELDRLALGDARYRPRGQRWHPKSIQRVLARLRPALNARLYLLSEPGLAELREAAARAAGTISTRLLAVANGTASPSEIAYVCDLFAETLRTHPRSKP